MQLSVEINYDYNKKPWVVHNKRYFCGSAFIGDKLLSEADIIKYIDSIKNTDDADDLAAKLNGHFALVIDFGDSVYLAVDRECTIPLFYKNEGNTVIVYNHISLETVKECGVDDVALNELNYCLFVSGRKNIAKNITTVLAGESVVITDSGVKNSFYHIFDYAKVDYPDREKLIEQIDACFTEVAKRLITYLNGRCAVIPLSGGHDSRLVAYYLKHLGYNNIITYTYGPEGNWESTTSKKVADFLGIEWHFVNYKPRILNRFFRENFERTFNYFSNGVSSFCVQDWYAVDYLHKNGIFPHDAVFVPGHSFDAIAGSFILPKYVQNDTVTKNQLIGDLIWKHYSEGKRTLPENVRKYFLEIFNENLLSDEPDILSYSHAFDLYQNYNVRERQAKFICNQTRLYMYYGYDWYLPLWDSELIDFWETIDIKTKYGRKLFFEFTEYKYGELMKAAPVENLKSKNYKKVNMNPIVRVLRKIKQLVNYVDFHYCLAYFTRFDVWSIFFRTGVLNIGFFVNQKIIKIVRKLK